jgi:hypothetical protein
MSGGSKIRLMAAMKTKNAITKRNSPLIKPDNTSNRSNLDTNTHTILSLLILIRSATRSIKIKKIKTVQLFTRALLN